MDNENTFKLSLDFEGRHYEGQVTSSEELSPNGMPVYFRVTLGDQLFAYLCCGDKGWAVRDGQTSGPEGLIQAIGNYIVDHYE